MVINKLQRGPVNDVKLLRVQFVSSSLFCFVLISKNMFFLYVRFEFNAVFEFLLIFHQLANLLSIYELRNHLLAIDSMLRTLVNLTVSSILDGPGPFVREAGCCLAYSLSIVKVSKKDYP